MQPEWHKLVAFVPSVSKDYQALVAIVLMSVGLCLTGTFSLNKSISVAPLLALPASLSLAFGAVFLICSVGVYV